MTVLEQLQEFVHGKERNRWLEDNQIQIYVRKSIRYLNHQRFLCLDLANINAIQQGQGVFTKFLQVAEQINPWEAVFVENVLTNRFACFFDKQGYTRTDSIIPCFYKMKS